MYTGAYPAKHTHPKGLAYDAVMSLLESRLDKGHAVYMKTFIHRLSSLLTRGLEEQLHLELYTCPLKALSSITKM